VTERQSWSSHPDGSTELRLVAGEPVSDREIVMLADLARGGPAGSPPPYEINFAAESHGLADVVMECASGAWVLNPDLTTHAGTVFEDELRRRTARYRRAAIVEFLDALPVDQAELIDAVCHWGPNPVSSAIAGIPRPRAAAVADAINLSAARYGLGPQVTPIGCDRLAACGEAARQLVAACAERLDRAAAADSDRAAVRSGSTAALTAAALG
jgi:hypothetical protein